LSEAAGVHSSFRRRRHHRARIHVGFTPGCGSIATRGPCSRAHPRPDTKSKIEEIPMKRLMALMLLAMFSLGTLTACNTMAGAGKDVQKVGEKVEDKAEDCKDGKC
jgi:predicted small secreted protein